MLIGNLRPANTSAAVLYAKPIGTRISIESIVIANTSAASATFRIFWDYGTTYDETAALAYDVQIDAGSMIMLNDLSWDFIGQAGNLAVRSSVSNALTFWVWGKETN